MILCVTGGREYSDKREVFRCLDAIHSRLPVTLMVHGDCNTGIDPIAISWCLQRGIEHTKDKWRAYWNVLKRASVYPITNGAMLRVEKPDLVLAFPGEHRTKDLLKQAIELGIKVMTVQDCDAMAENLVA